MTVSELIHSISQRLNKTHEHPQECQQEAWWLLQAITKKSEAGLLAQKNIELSAEEQKKLDQWLTQHIDQAMPLQYILGSVPFCDLEIMVETPVLIPRPETEEWCCNLIESLKKLSLQKFSILDIGSGSGAIALALAKNFPNSTVIGVDIADHALSLSKRNAQKNQVKNVTFLKSNLYSGLEKSIKFDLIVSNPPYIATREWKSLSPSVTDWEDKNALLAGPEGLDIITTIIEQAPRWLKPNEEMSQYDIPQLLIEIGYWQGDLVKKLLHDAGLRSIRIQKDLEGKDRVACASL